MWYDEMALKGSRDHGRGKQRMNFDDFVKQK